MNIYNENMLAVAYPGILLGKGMNKFSWGQTELGSGGWYSKIFLIFGTWRIFIMTTC